MRWKACKMIEREIAGAHDGAQLSDGAGRLSRASWLMYVGGPDANFPFQTEMGQRLQLLYSHWANRFLIPHKPKY